MWYLVTALVALTAGSTVGVMIGMRVRHSCITCRALVIPHCPPGFGCQVNVRARI